MLRINLLPAYIAEQRKLRIAIVLAVILFLIATAVPLAYYYTQTAPAVAKMQADDTDMSEKATEEQNQESKTSALKSQIAPVAEKVAFVQNVQFHNLIRQRIFRNAAKYTYRSVEYNAMSVAGTTLSISGTVTSLDDIGRFYLTMFGNPDVSAVSIAGVPNRGQYLQAQPIVTPGGPPPMPPQYHIAMNCTITHSVVPPALPASLGAGAAGAAGGMTSAPMMPPGGAPGAMPSGGPPPASAPSGGPPQRG